MLIGINGRIGAGKDTAANLLSLILEDFEITRSSFAAPLKQSAAALLGITLDELEWMKLDSCPSISVRVPLGPAPDYRYHTVSLTGRKYLERFGTESHRDVFGQSFWVDQALPSDFTLGENEVVLFTDCRFPNEAERIHEVGGYVVEVIGPNGREGNGHPSDSPLNDEMIDFFIDNTVRDDELLSLTVQLERLVASIALTQGVVL